MKRLIFDFDATLFSETEEEWLELYHVILNYQPRCIWLWSNGSKWIKKQEQSRIQFEHIEVENRQASDLELVDAAMEHAIAHGYAGSPHNAALVKRCPPGAVLIDDMAGTWVAVAKSHPEWTLTPEKFMQKINRGELTLTVDGDGYLATT